MSVDNKNEISFLNYQKIRDSRRALSADLKTVIDESRLVRWPLSMACLLSSLAILAAGILSVIAGARYDSIMLETSSIFFFGLFFVHTMVLLHEAAHNNLASSSRLNSAFGFILGLLSFNFFPSFRKAHLAHHREVESGDHAYEPKPSYPEVLFSLLFHLSGIHILNRLLKTNLAPGRAFLICSSLLVVGITLTLISFLGFWSSLIISYTYGSLFFGYWLRDIRGKFEHYQDARSGAHVTNTFRATLVNFAFFSPYGMNYHLEHHLYPQVPSPCLPRVRKAIWEKNSDMEIKRNVIH